MSVLYAAQADIDLRYPGALAQAGPRDDEGELDTDAITAALATASGLIEERLQALYPLPWTAPYPAWLVEIAVDIALYRATPAPVLNDFQDRKARNDAALARLADIAVGRAIPTSPPSATDPDMGDEGGDDVFFVSQAPRGFGDA
jgi:phage gp36-like protein